MRSTDPENTGMQKNINKLDSLLDDLQHVRQGTLNRGVCVCVFFLFLNQNKCSLLKSFNGVINAMFYF